MHRFYLPPEHCTGTVLRLEGAEARHARQVMRVRAGERVLVLDGAGRSCLCEVRALDARGLALAVLERSGAALPPARLRLCQALPKGKTLETIIQKATELGVAEILPVLSARAVPHMDEARGERKQEKWRQVAIEAIKQCGQPWLPQVLPPLDWASALGRFAECDLNLVAALQPGGQRVRQPLAEYAAQTGRPAASIGLWIGPEGDFTPAEVAALLAKGARPITLGKLVLRVETAAICALALVNDELNSEAAKPPR